MSLRRVVLAAVSASMALGLAVGARADATKVAFPIDYAKSIRWLVLDKEPQKQVHEIYAPPGAFEAARRGEGMPDGTVFVVVRYSAKLDDQGNPIKDASGRLVENELLSFNVMQKGKGWGAEYPDTQRNGQWEYRAFNADRTPNEQARLTGCFECHKSQESHDFVHAYERLTSAEK